MPERIIDTIGAAHLSIADAICALMIERGVPPAALRTAIAVYHARLAAEMAAAADAPVPDWTQPQDGMVCPRCGAALELQPLCPHVSPHWRTAVACSSDACTYHGLSVHPVPYLLRHGLVDNVEER